MTWWVWALAALYAAPGVIVFTAVMTRKKRPHGIIPITVNAMVCAMWPLAICVAVGQVLAEVLDKQQA